MNQWNEAVTAIEKGIEIDKSNSLAYLSLGIVNARQDRLKTALSNLNKAVELDPNSGLALFNRGLIHRMMGNEQLAQADIEKSKKLEPKIKVKDGFGVPDFANVNLP
jgi:Tfp pilus assembly protein PilF